MYRLVLVVVVEKCSVLVVLKMDMFSDECICCERYLI